MADKWEDQSDIVEYFLKKIKYQFDTDGKSSILEEILSEHFDKDDIREIYHLEFKEIDKA